LLRCMSMCLRSGKLLGPCHANDVAGAERPEGGVNSSGALVLTRVFSDIWRLGWEG
jgi:hypothetical protein